MSYSDRPTTIKGSTINGAFSNNVNSFNNYGGGGVRFYTDDGFTGYADDGGPPYAPQGHPTARRVRTEPITPNPTQSRNSTENQPAGRHVRTESMAPYPTQSRNLGVNYDAGNSPFFTGGAIFGEPRRGTPSPAPTEADVYGAPVREPPAWKLNYEIGSGTFGTVFLEKVQTREMGSPELWAVKRIPKAVPNFPARRYQEEAKNLHALSNYEWFVKFNSSYEDDHCVYIAMEYIPIGDMMKTFEHGYRWNESDTRVVIEQLLRGLVVMHGAGITHRDLKPENIFLYLPEDRTQTLRVKIGDFGTSKRIPLTSSSTYLRTNTGTQGYIAPEVEDTSNPKTNKVDIWSLGCIMYRMLTGSLLFNNHREIWKYAETASSPPPAVKDKGFSIPSQDFLRDVLQPNPENRPSAEGCLMMPWITNKAYGLEYAIGSDLYKRLAKIQCSAPDIDTFSDIATHRADKAPARSSTAGASLGSDSMASTPRSSWTSNTGSSITLGPHIGR